MIENISDIVALIAIVAACYVSLRASLRKLWPLLGPVLVPFGRMVRDPFLSGVFSRLSNLETQTETLEERADKIEARLDANESILYNHLDRSHE